MLGLGEETCAPEIRTDMAEVPRPHRAELENFHLVSSASLVEGRREDRTHFLQVMGHEPKGCGVDVVVVALELPSALALVVVLEEGYKPRRMEWSDGP